MGEVINLVNDFKVYNVIFNCGEYNKLENELIDVLDKKHIEYYSCIKELNIVLMIGLLLKNINLCDIISMEGGNMASAVIHMAIASEINKTLKRDNNKILIGTIAPDISKFIGRTKLESHFLESVDNNIPNIKKFLVKYKDKLNDDFVMGYFIHLYTDYLWFKYFVSEFYSDNWLQKWMVL